MCHAIIGWIAQHLLIYGIILVVALFYGKKLLNKLNYAMGNIEDYCLDHSFSLVFFGSILYFLLLVVMGAFGLSAVGTHLSWK